MTEFLSLLSLTPSSRQADHAISVSQEGNIVLTWILFLRELELIRFEIASRPENAWSLLVEDPGLFMLGLIALLQSGKQVHLPNTPPVHAPRPGTDLPLLSDRAEFATIQLPIAKASAGGVNGDFPRIDPATARLIFHTSGSTGTPKQITKTFPQIEAELVILAKLWGADFNGAFVYSTVSPQHFYGFLFSALLPFCLGAQLVTARIQYPESLISLGNRKTVLVTSPAFLKRIGENESRTRPFNPPRKVFSSGGFLPDSCALNNRAYLGTDIIEIYGSTETGGIAWRKSPGDSPWTCFPGIAVNSPDGIQLALSSPYLGESGFITIEDRVEIIGEGTFRLLGRTDSVVKIEEKRVALNDVENRIMQTGLVADVLVLAMEEQRQFLAAAIVLNPTGKTKFKDQPKNHINLFFREFLRVYFEPTVLPKKWRYLDSIPRNSQGKINLLAAKDLFQNQNTFLVGEPIIRSSRQTLDEMYLELIFPAHYVHFQGHFPEMKILPAVAQVDWVIKFMHKGFGLDKSIKSIPVCKLLKPIFPRNTNPPRDSTQQIQGAIKLLLYKSSGWIDIFKRYAYPEEGSMNPPSNISFCAVIPVYNHGSTTGTAVDRLVKQGLPVFLVDDGSDAATKKQLTEIVKRVPDCTLFTLPKNLGKGGAVAHGLTKAYQAGFSHALQVDADGQHDLEQIGRFIGQARKLPEALIAAKPVFDEAIPKGRKIGRKITNFWVTIETLSRDIPDAMCGFRVYPLQPCYRLLTAKRLTLRMEFDIEILVRLHWRGIRMQFLPLRVFYPTGGTSHFRMLKDNLAISRLHTILFMGMLLRFPMLLLRKIKRYFIRENTDGSLV
jgi:acyl-CoA synthetase (AMP-forming)/AMP-acid ligase II/glycosyltransferase involved in cell wall biosynthesis